MSSQIPPDPITTIYNPSAWAIPELTEEETIALDKAYIKFPIAQNQPITFPSSITIPTPASNSNTNLATTTAWVRTFWASVLAAANIWTGTQTFTNNMNVPTELTTSNTTVAASTAWVRLYWASLLSGSNIWTGTQTFTNNMNVPTELTTSNTTVAASTAWVRNYWASLLAGTNIWTGTQSFTNNMIVPTELTTSNTTVAASTAWVRNFFTYILTEPWSWSGIQSFTGGITANIINPVTAGGTLTIGNNVSGDVFIAAQVGRTGILHLGDGNNSSGAIHIGNGANATNNVNLLNGTGSTGVLNLGSATSTTRVNTPLTPNYTYPVTSGKIGYINSVSVASLAVVVSTVQQLTSLSVDAGTWILQGECGLSVGTSGSMTIAFNTSVSLTSARGVNNLQLVSTLLPANSTTITISQNASTTYYLIGRTSQAGNWTNIVFSATRIA